MGKEERPRKATKSTRKGAPGEGENPAEPSLPSGPDVDNRVTGEIVLKLTIEGAARVTESIPPGPLRRVAGAAPTSFGSSSLDEALAEFGVSSIVKVHGPISNAALSGGAYDALPEEPGWPPGCVVRRPASHPLGITAMGMSTTYRVRFSPDIDVDQAVKKLAASSDVAAAEPNRFRYAVAVPNDPMYGLEWGLTRIKCPEAWDRTKGSPTVVVAVVDSGVDLDHPDLAANLQLPGRDFVDLVGASPEPGWHFTGDYLTRDNDPQDEVGHGTHVAGTIAAVSNNAAGVAGVTWFCKVLPVKVLGPMEKNDYSVVIGVGTAVDIAAGIRWAADHGAHVINLSLGGYSNTFVEQDAVAYAVAKGCLVVAAMGNDDTNAPHYPAAYPDVVSVGAINQSNHRVTKANTGGIWGSNYGPHIDVVAPGLGVRSTDWDNTYSDKSGTSMASPHVAGVAALMKSCKPSLSAAEIANTLRKTAVPLKDDPADSVPNDRYGHGLVDAKAALASACPYVVKHPFLDPSRFPELIRDWFKLKITDEIPKWKLLDDVKLPGRDRWHPEMPGIRSLYQSGSGGLSDYAARLAEYQSALAALEQAERQGQLSEADKAQAAALRQQYETMLAEYQQTGGYGQPVSSKGPLGDKLKVVDDGKHKFRDDKMKFFDDKPKFFDDKGKFFDDKGKFQDDKHKFQDDKHKFQDDKHKFIDDPLIPKPGIPNPGPTSAAPFVLATPHHSMAWAQSYPGAYQSTIAGLEAKLNEYSQALMAMDQAYQEGRLGPAEGQQFEALCREYQALLAEYQKTTSQGQ